MTPRQARARSTCCSTAARTAATWSATPTQGNSSAFRCPYHGWTFSQHRRAARLPVQPGLRRHASARPSLGLGRGAARRRRYHGFVFGSLRRRRPDAARAPRRRRRRDRPAGAPLARAARSSSPPAGCKHKVKANWKMLARERDRRLPPAVRARLDLQRRRAAASATSTARSRPPSPATSATGTPRTTCARSSAGSASRWAGSARRPSEVPDYVAAMHALHGDDSASEILIDGAPHVMIFPNLFIAEIQMFVIQPLAVDETVQHVTARAVQGRAGHEPADAAADDRLGRPGRASCWPTTPRCTSATSAASQALHARSGSMLTRGAAPRAPRRGRPHRSATPPTRCRSARIWQPLPDR